MALIREFNGIKPQIGKGCFIAETACIIGDVVIGDNCSVWYNAVIRGDENPIRIGNNVNVQDCAVIHCRKELSKTDIGDNVTIGHNATVHGATIENDVLIGIGAIVLDDTIIHTKSIVAAGAMVSYNKEIESYCIYGGVPAKKLRDITEEESFELINRAANNYLSYKDIYIKQSTRE